MAVTRRRPPNWIPNRYCGMTSAEIHAAAQERVRHYSQPHPDSLASRYALLRAAWEWVERQHRIATP